MVKLRVSTESFLIGYMVASFFFLFSFIEEILLHLQQWDLSNLSSNPIVTAKSFMMYPIIGGMIVLLILLYKEKK